MYTIKQAAARSGVSVSTLRAWERRYSVVEPQRTPAGYRLYDDESIARLSAMRHLVDAEGWQPSQAASRVGEPGVDLSTLLGATPEIDQPVPVAGLVDYPDPRAERVEALLAAAKGLDVPAMERVLDEALAAERFELAIEGVVSPTLGAIGEAWATGAIDVAVEHAASETVRRRLAGFFRAAGDGAGPPQVVIGMPPGADHEIGALAFAVAARRAGVRVLYLGANVPLASWVRTAEETMAPIVLLGVVTPTDATAAAGVIESLRGTDRPPICLVGGRLAVDSAALSGVNRLPGRLDEAVAVVLDLLRPGKKRGR